MQDRERNALGIQYVSKHNTRKYYLHQEKMCYEIQRFSR